MSPKIQNSHTLQFSSAIILMAALLSDPAIQALIPLEYTKYIAAALAIIFAIRKALQIK